VNRLTLTHRHAALLGLPDDQQYLAYVGRMVSARLVSPCEAACVVANIPLAWSDTSVDYVSSVSPERRTMLRTSSTATFIPPVNVYAARPLWAENFTFTHYFTVFLTTTKRAGDRMASTLVGTACLRK
jgi:hypothetical protein